MLSTSSLDLFRSLQTLNIRFLKDILILLQVDFRYLKLEYIFQQAINIELLLYNQKKRGSVDFIFMKKKTPIEIFMFMKKKNFMEKKNEQNSFL